MTRTWTQEGREMSKDYRNPPDTHEGVWAWMFGDEPPLEVAAAMRHKGIRSQLSTSARGA